jgi:uncharacterized protein (TIGR02246 family)
MLREDRAAPDAAAQSRHFTLITAIVLIGLGMATASSSTAAARATPADLQAQVQTAVDRFLHAFENLDIDGFMACFAPDSTVFFPTPEPPQRFDGKAAIREHFQTVFAAIRRSSTSSVPPYHRLEVQDLAVQLVADEAAIVTFHLRNAERIARRTLVLKRTDEGWLIVHLHASNVPIAAGQPGTSPSPAPLPRGTPPTR